MTQLQRKNNDATKKIMTQLIEFIVRHHNMGILHINSFSQSESKSCTV